MRVRQKKERLEIKKKQVKEEKESKKNCLKHLIKRVGAKSNMLSRIRDNLIYINIVFSSSIFGNVYFNSVIQKLTIFFHETILLSIIYI